MSEDTTPLSLGKKQKKGVRVITAREYYLLRNMVVEMLYDRSEQDVGRYGFERGCLDIYRMIPYDVVESIYDDYAKDGSISTLNFQYSVSSPITNEDASPLITKAVILFADRADEVRTLVSSLYGKVPPTTHIFIFLTTGHRPEPSKLSVPSFAESQFEVFWYKQMLFNITKHVLVPKHELLSETVKDTLLQTYYLESITQLPTILSTDPVAKWYGMLEGDICRITRENPNVGTTHIYRYVTVPALE